MKIELLSIGTKASYKYLGIVFLIMLFLFTVVRSLLQDLFAADYIYYLGPIAGPFALLFLFQVLRMILNLTENRKLTYAMTGLMLVSIAMRGVSIFQDRVSAISLLGILSTVFLIVILSVCVYYMCINLFIQENTIIEKLWASVCVYFMLGAIFASVYSIFLIFDPAAFGIAFVHPAEIFIMSLVYSINILSGLDPILQHTSQTIQWTAVYESLLSTLFLVILIGRLLGSK